MNMRSFGLDKTLVRKVVLSEQPKSHWKEEREGGDLNRRLGAGLSQRWCWWQQSFWRQILAPPLKKIEVTKMQNGAKEKLGAGVSQQWNQ